MTVGFRESVIRKSSILFFVSTFLFAESVLYAQTQNVSATGLVNLDVRGVMGVSTARDMTLGTVVQGTTLSNINPITGGNSAAYFEFTAPPDTPVTVTYSFTSLSSGSSSVDFKGLLSGSPSTDQKKSTMLQSGTTIVTSSDGEFHFWAGGTADLSASQGIGVYTGTFILTIAY